MDLDHVSGTWLDVLNLPPEFTGFTYSSFYSHVGAKESDVTQLDSQHDSVEFPYYRPPESTCSQTSSAESSNPLYTPQQSLVQALNFDDGYGFEHMVDAYPSYYLNGQYVKHEEDEREGVSLDSAENWLADKTVEFSVFGNSWIASSKISFDGNCVLKERMMHALRHIMQSTVQGTLLQMWVPVKIGDEWALTTAEQPFALDAVSPNLVQYRNISVAFTFSADDLSVRKLGLPGRVFWRKLPEWTPNVQYYGAEEYLRLVHAKHHDVRGSLAVPVFESAKGSCVGVLELVMTSEKIQYAADVIRVSKALEVVHLKSSDAFDLQNIQVPSRNNHDVLAQLEQVLTAVCNKHNLPLAQTWVPSRHCRFSTRDTSSDKSSQIEGYSREVFMFTRDKAFYVLDTQLQDFRKACTEHYLTRGQGIVGQALLSQKPSYCGSISQFNKSDYPLVHYARMFGLVGAVAIPVQCMKKGTDSYVVEFFMPLECKDSQQQACLLESIFASFKEFQHSSTFVFEELLQEEKSEASTTIKSCLSGKASPREMAQYPSNIQQACPEFRMSLAVGEGERKENIAAENVSHHIRKEKQSKRINFINAHASPWMKSTSKDFLKQQSDKRQGKIEKSISVDVLRQYFSGSLKDASKSLGVCPTTLKRICRQHGIARWPSRKINKINNSLRKLQDVIESVKVAQHPSTVSACRSSSIAAASKHLSPSMNVITQADLTSKAIMLSSNPQKQETVGDDALLESQFPSGQQNINYTSAEGAADSFELTKHKNQIHNQRGAVHGMLKSNNADDCNGKLLAPASYQNLTIKVAYKDDIIRFRLPLGSGLHELLKEVTERLKVNMASMNIKYLDCDSQWVTLTCDADLDTCIQKLKSSFGNLIRLIVDEKFSSSSYP